ncbi:F-box protein [Dorcoceras hygrometricum]|uniref:F-box protein n=1 Tax=Dorcoceras hygrometricum TaxID=472368 RepID=A0A2Z7A736_9LAMI|nr:F-box protein [Dorcoceras hygrometricum]
MSSYTSAAAAEDHGGGTPITAIHSDIVRSHILNRLDGPTLASTSCASSRLFSLCNDDHLWREICSSTWPSTTDPRVRAVISGFSSGYRSLYSDAFPSVAHQRSAGRRTKKRSLPSGTSELISAVDIYCDDKLIYSKVMVTETHSGWFMCSPFRLDLLDPKETVPVPLIFDGEDGNCMQIASDRLRVSWILIDPAKSRAVSVASLKAVEARRHWLTEEVLLRFATVASGGDDELFQCAVMLTFGGREGKQMHAREVYLQVEDVEGKIVRGMESLGILREAMEGPRCISSQRMEKEKYEMLVKMKIECLERKQRRERSLDMAFVAIAVSIFLAILIYFLNR